MDPEQDLQLGDSKRKREIEKEKGNLKKDREGQKIIGCWAKSPTGWVKIQFIISIDDWRDSKQGSGNFNIRFFSPFCKFY